MALVKFGGGILNMSGKLGGNVYARNRSGNYVRSLTMPVDPKTPRQVQARSNIQALANDWSQTLTAAQREAWELYASNVNVLNRLGETISLTGYNQYVRTNAILLGASQSRVNDGPTIFELASSDPTFTVTISEATQDASIVFDDTLPWLDEDDAYMVIYQGEPRQDTRNFFNGNKRIIGVIAGDSVTPPTTPATIAVDFVSSEGQAIAMYGRIVRADGRASEPFRDDVIVGS